MSVDKGIIEEEDWPDKVDFMLMRNPELDLAHSFNAYF